MTKKAKKYGSAKKTFKVSRKARRKSSKKIRKTGSVQSKKTKLVSKVPKSSKKTILRAKEKLHAKGTFGKGTKIHKVKEVETGSKKIAVINSRKPYKTEHEGGFKFIRSTVFHLPKTTVKNKINLIKGYEGEELSNNIKWNKNAKRVPGLKGYKPPKAVYVTLVTSKGNKKFYRNVKITPTEFIVNERNIKAYLEGLILKHEDDYIEHIEDNDGETTDSSWVFNTNNITEIDVKFIY